MRRKDTSHLARRKQAVADGGGNARTRKMRQRRVDLGAEAPATGGGARVSEGTPLPAVAQQRGRAARGVTQPVGRVESPEFRTNGVFTPTSGQEDVLDANARTVREVEARQAFNPYTLYQGLK